MLSVWWVLNLFLWSFSLILSCLQSLFKILVFSLMVWSSWFISHNCNSFCLYYNFLNDLAQNWTKSLISIWLTLTPTPCICCCHAKCCKFLTGHLLRLLDRTSSRSMTHTFIHNNGLTNDLVQIIVISFQFFGNQLIIFISTGINKDFLFKIITCYTLAHKGSRDVAFSFYQSQFWT